MPRRAADQTTITFTLDKATKHTLRLLAAQEDGGMSALLRNIIADALSRRASSAPERARDRESPGEPKTVPPAPPAANLEASPAEDLALL